MTEKSLNDKKRGNLDFLDNLNQLLLKKIMVI
jgi:hypothetical protein